MPNKAFYLSPEIIENKPSDSSSDIWALGIVLYEMWCFKTPFHSDSLHELAIKIVKGEYSPIPSHFSEDLSILLSNLLNINWKERFSIDQILAIPILKDRVSQYNERDIVHVNFGDYIKKEEDNTKLKDLLKVSDQKTNEPEEIKTQMKIVPLKDQIYQEDYFKLYIKPDTNLTDENKSKKAQTEKVFLVKEISPDKENANWD